MVVADEWLDPNNLLMSQLVPARVDHDPHEPRPKAGGISQPAERAPCLEGGLVDGILGFATVAQNPSRKLVRRAEFRRGKPPELLASVGSDRAGCGRCLHAPLSLCHGYQVCHHLSVLRS